MDSCEDATCNILHQSNSARRQQSQPSVQRSLASRNRRAPQAVQLPIHPAPAPACLTPSAAVVFHTAAMTAAEAAAAAMDRASDIEQQVQRLPPEEARDAAVL